MAFGRFRPGSGEPNIVLVFILALSTARQGHPGISRQRRGQALRGLHRAVPTGGPKAYFRLLNIASGPEVVYFWGLNTTFLPQNPLEKVGSFAPDLFQQVCGRRGPFPPPNKFDDFRPGGEQPEVPGPGHPRPA